LTHRILRWERSGWHHCILDQPIANACGLAADPLSSDLYIAQGASNITPESTQQRILRLIPTGSDHYHVEVFASGFNKLSDAGIAFSYDGKRMIITDSGNRAIVVLKRVQPPPSAPIRSVKESSPSAAVSAAAPDSITIEGWNITAQLSHSSRFSSPHFAPGRKVIYCSKSRLRIVSDSGGEAENFLELKPQTPGFSGVAPDSGFVTWTQPNGGQHPTIGRAKADGSLLNPLEFATKEPPYPMGVAFVTAANLSPGLQPGDVLLACSRNDQHPESKPGLWRFRCDNDEPVTLLGTDETLLQYPMDVASSNAGVFLLNRSTLEPEPNLTAADTNRRILRWDGTAFHPCILSEPVQDPCALAADPLTTDLYVLQGAQGRDPKLQRLLRLKLTQADTYNVEVLISNLGGPAPCGLCFSADGKRLLVGDTGGKRTLVLERQ
jgi:DNA-binding beta-propeller fold protein YncE